MVSGHYQIFDLQELPPDQLLMPTESNSSRRHRLLDNALAYNKNRRWFDL
jgi:hypothetical protein